MKISMIIAATGCMVLLNFGCGRKQESVDVPRNVKVIMPENADSTITREFNGIFEEARKADLAFRVGGPVSGVFAEEGDFIRAGELLAAIDPRDYQVQFKAAEAQYNQAKGEYERFRELYQSDKLPANTFEKLETAWLSAKSNYEKAQNALADTRLTSPFSGIVFQKNINRHETIGPGVIAFTIIDINELEVVFGIPESLVSIMSAINNVKVESSGLIIPARVKSIAGKTGEDNLFEIRLALQNPDSNLVRPGMNARIILETTREKLQVPSLPLEAVFYQKEQPFVWIYNERTGSVTSRKINTGRILSGGHIEVLSGINGHEKVVSAGVHSLYENQQVRNMSFVPELY